MQSNNSLLVILITCLDTSMLHKDQVLVPTSVPAVVYHSACHSWVSCAWIVITVTSTSHALPACVYTLWLCSIDLLSRLTPKHQNNVCTTVNLPGASGLIECGVYPWL